MYANAEIGTAFVLRQVQNKESDRKCKQDRKFKQENVNNKVNKMENDRKSGTDSI